MTVLHHEYETVVIVRPDLDDADTYGIVERFEKIIVDNGGHVLLRDDWGKRKLAYTIDKQQKGHYVLLNHLSPAELVDELERIIRNEDRVLRFMTVLLDRAVDVPERLESAEETRKRHELERAARLQAEAEAEAAARALENEDDDDDDGDSD